jgi:hypothetical protein
MWVIGAVAHVFSNIGCGERSEGAETSGQRDTGTFQSVIVVVSHLQGR